MFKKFNVLNLTTDHQSLKSPEHRSLSIICPWNLKKKTISSKNWLKNSSLPTLLILTKISRLLKRNSTRSRRRKATKIQRISFSKMKRTSTDSRHHRKQKLQSATAERLWAVWTIPPDQNHVFQLHPRRKANSTTFKRSTMNFCQTRHRRFHDQRVDSFSKLNNWCLTHILKYVGLFLESKFSSHKFKEWFFLE